MLKHSRWVYGAALAAMLGGGSVVLAQQTTSEAEAETLFAKLDKNSDGKLTKDEVPDEQTRFFARLVRLGDKDQDGALTKDEFQQANKPEEKPNNVPLGPGGPPRDPKEAFKQFDKNNDGKLSRDELPEPLRDRLGRVFERLGKEELTSEEWAQATERMRRDFEDRAGQAPDGRRPEGTRPAEGTRRPEQPRGEEGRPPLGNPEEMFDRLDANGDGKVSVEEAPERAKPIVTQTLRRAGKDADGSLTKDEFLKNLPTPPRGGEGPRRSDGERTRESDRRPDDGRRPEGDRGPNARRPEGERDPEGRRPEGDRRAEGRRPEGDRRPEARGPEGDRRPDGPRGPILIRKLDKNNDGRVSKDELARLIDLFEELDTNHDGQLDPPELIGGPMGPPRDGDGPRPGTRRPDGDRGPEGRRSDGNARPNADGYRDGDRPQPPRGAGAERRPGQPRGDDNESQRERRPQTENEKPTEPKAD